MKHIAIDPRVTQTFLDVLRLFDTIANGVFVPEACFTCKCLVQPRAEVVVAKRILAT